jgi:hypothetical protein
VPEQEALERLLKSWPNAVAGQYPNLHRFFAWLREFDHRLASATPGQLYESTWALLGILNRSFELMLCAVDQLAVRNLNGFHVAARGMAETVCSIVWISENPARTPTLVQAQPRALGKLLNAGYNKYPVLRKMYADLSDIAHPNRASHLLSPRGPDERQGPTPFGPFALDFSLYFAEVMLEVLETLSGLAMAELESLLAEHPKVLSGGRLMVRVGAVE